jgi:hypothetical protein
MNPTVSRTHWQLKDALPGVEIFNDSPAANPIEVSPELPVFVTLNIIKQSTRSAIWGNG